MKVKWKGWLSLCLAFVLGLVILPTAVSADNEFDNLRLYTGAARVTSDMYVSDDTGKYVESVNENCPVGYKRDGYRIWRLDERNYTVASKWVSDNTSEWSAAMSGYFAPENIMLAPNWVPEYSANPITAENPTVVIGDGSIQDSEGFYYQWFHEYKVVGADSYQEGMEQLKASNSVNASYSSENGKWTVGGEQSYMELMLALQPGDVVTVREIGSGTDPQNYFSGYLKGGAGSTYLESFDHRNDVFYATATISGNYILHMQNNMNPNSLQVSVAVSRYEAENGEVGTKTYSGEPGTYCCKVSYIRNGSSISFMTNSVKIAGTEGPGPGTEEPGPGTEEPGPGTEEPGPGTEEPGPGTENPDPGNKEYALTKADGLKNGTYVLKSNGREVQKVEQGHTVTVETSPAKGYKTASVKYWKTDDANAGEPVNVPLGSDGNASFLMPAYDVTVAVTFQAGTPDIQPAHPPKIEITLDGTSHTWNAFHSKVSFDLIYNKAKQFKVKVTDQDNDVDESTIKYYLTDSNPFQQNKDYTVEEIESVLSGKWQDKADTVNLDKDGKYVLYVKASDSTGHVVYANTQGIVIDTTAPVISGVKNGGTYYGKTTFKATDAYLDKVTIDGKKVQPKKGVYTIKPDNASHKIVAVDQAGNQISCKVTVYETWMRDGITKNGVYELKKGTAYKLGKGKWKIVGDDTVYKGGMTFYVPADGDYDFQKQ